MNETATASGDIMAADNADQREQVIALLDAPGELELLVRAQQPVGADAVQERLEGVAVGRVVRRPHRGTVLARGRVRQTPLQRPMRAIAPGTRIAKAARRVPER